MHIQDAEIVDTFAEAFKMSAARVIITGLTPEWAMNSAVSMTGFATSIIGCKCEAGIERTLEPEETPDGRPGVSVLLFAMNAEGELLASALVEYPLHTPKPNWAEQNPDDWWEAVCVTSRQLLAETGAEFYLD